MKRLTTAVKVGAETLAGVQAQIRQAKKKLAALEAQEQELLGVVTPAFGDSQESEERVIHCVRGDVVVTYTFVSRMIADVPKAERMLNRLGKAMPMRKNEYAFVRARRIKT